MARTPDTHPGKGFPVSRRIALLGSILAPSAVLAACAEKTPDNSAVIADLKSKLGITPTTTRESFAQHAARIGLENPSWLIGQRIQYANDNGDKITKEILPDGSPNTLSSSSIAFLEYPDPRTVRITPTVEIFLQSENKKLVVYATANTVDLFKKNRKIIDAFLQEYFSSVSVPSFLHLVFLPNAPVDIFESADINTQPLKSPSHQAATDFLVDKEGNVRKLHVSLNLPIIHKTALNIRASISSQLILGLSNEITNVLAQLSLPQQNRRKLLPETVSTLAGILAEIDRDFAKMILGGSTYEPFVKLVADEMQRIGKLKKVA